MTPRLTLEDVLAAARVVARIMDGAGGAVAVARAICARASGCGADGHSSCGRMSLAAAARIELERSGVAARRPVSQRRMLIAAAAVCATLTEEAPAPAAAQSRVRATAR